LPSPLSYAGVLLGLLALPDAPTPVIPTIPSPAKSNPLLPQPTKVVTPITFRVFITVCCPSPKSCTTALQSPLSQSGRAGRRSQSV
jgi:hypothetical protein